MLRDKVRVEIYEGDPFTGCCGPAVASPSAVEKLRKTLTERNATVKALTEVFKDQIAIERQIVGTKRRYDTFPPQVSKLLLARTRLPFILIDGQLASEGKFPPLDDFRQLIAKHILSLRDEIPRK